MDKPQRNLLRNAVDEYVASNFNNKNEEFTIDNMKNKDIKRFVEFQPGEQVLILRVPKPHFISADLHEKFKINRGLQDRYKGPYSIVEKISPSTYKVNIKRTNQTYCIGSNEKIQRLTTNYFEIFTLQYGN